MSRLWLVLAASASLLLGAGFLWGGATHHGPGLWLVGGEDSDQRTISLSERTHKRNCYAAGGLFVAIAIGLSFEAFKSKPSGNEGHFESA